MSGYTDTIRQWATDTRRAGTLPDADGTGEVGLDSAEFGKRLAVRFALKVDRDRVTDLRYQVFGCGFSMAACAVAAELALGCQLDVVRTIDAQQLRNALEGFPSERSYCADLAADALQAAVTSARKGHRPEQVSLRQEPDHGPLMTSADPVYNTLVTSPRPAGVTPQDRHLFACLLAVAAREPCPTSATLGLGPSELTSILNALFPAIDPVLLERHKAASGELPPVRSDEVLQVLLAHVPSDTNSVNRTISTWLARIIAARAAHPGHLWIAMGLFERPQLSAAIRRHLPSLAAANNRNMRWKRYLYKQVCDRNGGRMCKSPDCGTCSDYVLCFADD